MPSHAEHVDGGDIPLLLRIYSGGRRDIHINTAVQQDWRNSVINLQKTKEVEMMSEDVVGNQPNVELHEAHVLSEASSVSLRQMTIFIWLAWVVTVQYQRTLKN